MSWLQWKKEKLNSNIRTPDEVNDDLYKDKPIPGSQVYNYYCISCHQRNGKGMETVFLH
jgi:cytochrome c